MLWSADLYKFAMEAYEVRDAEAFAVTSRSRWRPGSSSAAQSPATRKIGSPTERCSPERRATGRPAPAGRSAFWAPVDRGDAYHWRMPWYVDTAIAVFNFALVILLWLVPREVAVDLLSRAFKRLKDLPVPEIVIDPPGIISVKVVAPPAQVRGRGGDGHSGG
jgi:hypothetical protein